MEANPYAAPAAVVEDAAAYCADDLEARKASRGKRLGAAALDIFISLIGLIPLVWGGVSALSSRSGTHDRLSSSSQIDGYLLGFSVMLGTLLINAVLLHRCGQTMGKRALNIAIARSDGGRVGLTRVFLLRAMPISLISMVPFVGKLGWLVDVLMIFRDDRRCLHDLIADTIVVDV